MQLTSGKFYLKAGQRFGGFMADPSCRVCIGQGTTKGRPNIDLTH